MSQQLSLTPSYVSGESSLGSLGHSSGSENDQSYISTSSNTSTTGKRSGKQMRKTAESKMSVVTPWYPQGMAKSKLKLGDEIDALFQMLKLTPEETSRRHMARSTIQEVLQKNWPEATVKVYGSFAYGMSLPQSSLDLVCEDCESFAELPSILRQFGESHIEIEGFTSDEDTAFARLKVGSGVTANISFVIGKSSARKSVAEIRRLVKQFPACAEVYAVVRLVLQQSRCGDARQGGLSSYAALVMLLHACYRCQKPEDPSQLLIDFFKIYGTGSGPMNEPLFVEDPLCPENDVAAGCVRMVQIRAMFQNCAMTLEKWSLDKWDGYRGRSPLSSILAYDGLWAGKRSLSDKFVN
eukprot:TRINITY_DN736_c13_g1_i1.p1 TRINITY_DN736_c13_g1~~TRINITY_DN736_c13_g1_i1.p1  ORF type:complete len:380 (+),score=48.75 TRINITY_DN736_c13_g1_i1:83-1141(+)